MASVPCKKKKKVKVVATGKHAAGGTKKNELVVQSTKEKVIWVHIVGSRFPRNRRKWCTHKPTCCRK
ncbi:hypothetical protein EUGRSUZ_H02756 [Eucalyptus grandis]|uniref:Uncharacterized protein n=2 Tax=Eucalyptus grandis TaxID=71139 RepID=A0ACC3JTF8_EUCGR|nr:hypothetical protein EUGRSUZ_H02756 [Eucalyptus grandis]